MGLARSHVLPVVILMETSTVLSRMCTESLSSFRFTVTLARCDQHTGKGKALRTEVGSRI